MRAEAVNQQSDLPFCEPRHEVQPRDKPLAFWKAEVQKMKKVYGAPIPDDQIDPSSEYLARNYGTGK